MKLNATIMNNRATHIYLEMTPNPNTMKFVANYLLMPEGQSYSFTSPEKAEASPLAKTIFNEYAWVQEVFFSSNYITLTKTAETDWNEVQMEARNFIAQTLTQGTEVIMDGAQILEEKSPEPVKEEDEHAVAKIKGILDEYIRPAVEMDGGAINFHSFDKGVVKVLLQGSCSGCPSSTVTLKAGIEALLKRAMPEVEAVEAIDV